MEQGRNSPPYLERTVTMAYNFKTIFNPLIRRLFEAIFNVSTGHNHDGVNSKAVTTGVPAVGALAATAGGRAMIADDYFTAAQVLAKFDADSFDNAQLILTIKDGAFNADAATRALFDDGIWTLAKMATTAKTHIFNYIVEDLGAGVDITARPVFIVPTGFVATVQSAYMIPLGSGAGIDDGNNCLVGISDGTNGIASVAYDSAPGYPAENSINSLGTIDATHGILVAGEPLCITITNGATANPPAMMIQVSYTLADE